MLAMVIRLAIIYDQEKIILWAEMLTLHPHLSCIGWLTSCTTAPEQLARAIGTKCSGAGFAHLLKC